MQTFTGPYLREVFNLAPGYYGPCWVDITEEGYTADRPVPWSLEIFLAAVHRIIRDQALTPRCAAGWAYVRIVDAGAPENHMLWHWDNESGGIRFATSIATDDARVQVAWPEDPGLCGLRVDATGWEGAYQPDNGAIAMFTTEVHGVIPQPDRPGALTANFFATFAPSREEAELYKARCISATGIHPVMPGLEATR